VAPASRTLRPEDEISHYRVVGPLGAGGMGEVYLAKDRTLERSVALKVLPPELTRSEERVRRFVLEAKSASSLSHPNIVTIYEIGQDSVRAAGEPHSGPIHFISMELVSGKTLSTLIHDDRTDLRTLLGYLAQAADGLAKAHAAGIVHRDLKPGNIMVSSDGFAKVLDFGLAKLTETNLPSAETSNAPTRVADATGEGMVVGTAGYMSPEQVQGRAVDHRSDIFSFGCLLYEATARKRPFAAETGVETMHKILHDKPAALEELNPQAPAELRRLVRRCLAKSPEQRLQSMKDLALELREIVDEYEALSASASSGTMASAVAAPVPRRWTAPGLWIGVGVVAVAGLALGWWGIQRGRAPRQPFQNMRASVHTSRGDVIEGALSPDGRFLAYVAGRPGSWTLRVRQVATGSDVEILPVSELQIRSPSFSPDGNYLFYSAMSPTRQNYLALFQVPSLGGASRERIFDVDSRVSFSPDGKTLVFWRRFVREGKSDLMLFDLDSDQERILATVPDQEAFQGAPAWSPDGRRIAAALLRPAPDLQTTIALFDPATGRRQDMVKLPMTILNSVAWLRDRSGIVASGQDLRVAVSNQVFLFEPSGGRSSRVTNDFNEYSSVSTSVADETIAAVRGTHVTNVWYADASGGAARRLTSAANPETSPFTATALDSASVLFSWPRDRHIQLAVVPIAGGEPRFLTSGEAHSINQRTAAGVIVFDRLDASGVHVWTARPDGGSPRKLTSGAGEQIAALSRDGRHVIVSHYDSPRRLSILSTADGRVVQDRVEAVGLLGFSPDSRTVLFASVENDERGLNYTMWRAVPVEGGPPTVTFRLPDDAMGPAWGPDGRSVTFRSRTDPSWNVHRFAFGASRPVQVTRFTRGRVTGTDWSRDGRKLAVRLQEGESVNLWVTDADGGRPVQVTRFASERAFGFNWMPDGRGLAVIAGTDASDMVLIRDIR
jgi:Tol biopolymer transport system component